MYKIIAEIVVNMTIVDHAKQQKKVAL